jgi:hypothetical protein
MGAATLRTFMQTDSAPQPQYTAAISVCDGIACSSAGNGCNDWRNHIITAPLEGTSRVASRPSDEGMGASRVKQLMNIIFTSRLSLAEFVLVACEAVAI